MLNCIFASRRFLNQGNTLTESVPESLNGAIYVEDFSQDAQSPRNFGFLYRELSKAELGEDLLKEQIGKAEFFSVTFGGAFKVDLEDRDEDYRSLSDLRKGVSCLGGILILNESFALKKIKR